MKFSTVEQGYMENLLGCDHRRAGMGITGLEGSSWKSVADTEERSNLFQLDCFVVVVFYVNVIELESFLNLDL